MNAIEVGLREYGQKRDTKALQDLTESTDIEQLLSMVKKKLYHSTFPHTFNYLMQSFEDTEDAHEKRFRVVTQIVRELENGDMVYSQSSVLLSRICMDLMKFKSAHLISVCSICIESIQKGNVTNMCWRDLLPELLNVLVERETIENNGIEMSGVDYKSQVIDSLCLMEWSASILTSLVSMFSDMPLTKDEHSKVVNKLCNSLEKLTCQEVPAFVYQMLKLCRYQNSRGLFIRLQKYFENKVYSRLNTPDSETADFDVIEAGSDHNAQQAEATVIYHIHQAAYLGHDSIKEYVNSLKNATKAPETILNPFQLGILLSLGTINSYEDKVFDIIKSCTSRAFQEEDRKLDSFWLRETVTQHVKVDAVFSQVIDVSIQERDLVLEGLATLSFTLLGIGSPLGRDPIAEKQWKLGTKILLKLLKRKRQIAPIILQTLTNRILTGHSVNQYTECVYLMSKNMPLSLIENMNRLIELVDILVQVPANVAADLLDAVIPLSKLSHSVRDHLIILLRKALYSRDTETRQFAVTGFLKLLITVKISNLAALSQSSSSSSSFCSERSVFTQISLNQTSNSGSSNEALCLEVLRILKRCFMQQAEVKARFYKELYGAVRMNPELGLPVLEALWIHFGEYYVADEEVLPPLKFEGACLVKDPDVVLKEPLGILIYSIGLIVVKLSEDDDANVIVKKFKAALDSLVERMIQCELIHFGLDDGTDLLDVLPESQKKVIILKQALLVYEALMGYKMHSWGLNSENCGQHINSLFQGYTRLIHLSKNITKPKKADAKKKKTDADKTTQSSDTALKKDAPQKPKSFKLPETVLDLKIIVKALNLLYRSDLAWTTPAQSNVIKTKVEIHRYMLQVANESVLSQKNVRILDKQIGKEMYDCFVEIAAVLYERCLIRMEEFVDFDSTTAVAVAECFYNILSHLMTHNKNNLVEFLCAIGNTDKSDGLEKQLIPFIQTFKDVYRLENEDIGSEESDIKKISAVAINTLVLLANQIPVQRTVIATELLDWLKEVVSSKGASNKSAASSLIGLLLDAHRKFKPGVQLFENMAVRLGNVMGTINEEEQNCEELKFVNELIANTAFQSVCGSIKVMLDDADWVINRLKAEYHTFNYLGLDSSDKRKDIIRIKERGINCHLCFLTSILAAMSNITIHPGGNCELLLKCLAHLYNTLSSLTKYFIAKSTKLNVAFENTRFERVVKLTGKHLSPSVYKLIVYIEECQKQTTEATQAKKKAVNTSSLKTKVLRETRTIPKVVYEIEQFSKSIIQLSNKTKVDLAKFVGQGTARDFRIMNLRQVLENQGSDLNATGSTDSQAMNSTRNDATGEEEMEVDNVEEEEESGPAKRARV